MLVARGTIFSELKTLSDKLVATGTILPELKITSDTVSCSQGELKAATLSIILLIMPPGSGPQFNERHIMWSPRSTVPVLV